MPQQLRCRVVEDVNLLRREPALTLSFIRTTGVGISAAAVSDGRGGVVWLPFDNHPSNCDHKFKWDGDVLEPTIAGTVGLPDGIFSLTRGRWSRAGGPRCTRSSTSTTETR